jgi:hypothetical protein
MSAGVAGKTARHFPASFSNVCRVAWLVPQPVEVTITTCCALPTFASCSTSSGGGGAGATVADRFGWADAVGPGFGLAFGLGFAVAANAWVDADELAPPGALTTAPADETPAAVSAELPAASLAGGDEALSDALSLTMELVVALAEFGVRLLVQAARLAAQATAATHEKYRANPRPM